MTELGKACIGTWSGGRFMDFGEDIGEERLIELFRQAYRLGIRTFMSADVYGNGEADRLLGKALAGFDRDSYCLIGSVGHDFYNAGRVYDAYPRFTDPSLRGPDQYAGYLRMATEKSLERLGVRNFDLLFLHNPDHLGYTHEKVWQGLEGLRREGLTRLLGVAPGPANGFTLDLINCFERYGELIDWAMVILNPFEPWPAQLALPAARQFDVKVLTRVVDYGGLFLDGLKPNSRLKRGDHRAFRPAGWIEAAQPKLERLREIGREHELTLFQVACQWNLAQPAVASVVPTLIQEPSPSAPRIEEHLETLARLDHCRPLSPAAISEIAQLGDNSNCMALKGGSTQFQGKAQGDQWPLTPDLEETARRWKIVPDRDLYFSEDPRDLREKGAPLRGIPQASNRRLYLQLLVYSGCQNLETLAAPLARLPLEHVLYRDLNDPCGVGVLFIAESPEVLAGPVRQVLGQAPFTALTPRPELTMFGRTYSSGREPELEDWLLVKPRRNALNPDLKWAIWYPLRRKPEFNLLHGSEQGKILMEHGLIGRTYGKAGYAQDIRLACFGIDQHDNEFVIGLLGEELYPLSRCIQEMRKTQQTAQYMQSLGPFFVGRVHQQSPLQRPKSGS